jgi:glucose-6-phosphate 1-dehydrogenase
VTTLQPTILVIIGISGDLAQRKLLPAIEQIARAESLPEQFQMVGITRRDDVTIDSLLKLEADFSYLRQHSELFKMDPTIESEYARLATHLKKIEKKFGRPAQRLFYLSVPPQVSQPIIELLGKSGLAKTGQTKLLLEKPFGVDLASAQELIEDIDHYFEPEQVYRIDHYLAKETAQNIVVFRENNSLFKRTWNQHFIESIEIIASEEIDIQGRAAFYEQTGALRDLVQSHLLQLAALTLMKPPLAGKMSEVPARRLAALQSLRLPLNQPIETIAKRGQYRGYGAAVGNEGSTVETFVSLQLESTDPQWEGVPITLTTGKALKEKFTEIRILYKRDEGYEANELILRLQPNEGVELFMWAKRPGYEHTVSPHALRFAFKEHYTLLPEAYEQVLFSGLKSDHSLFATSEEVLETWRILDPVQKAWGLDSADLILYDQGSDVREVTSVVSADAETGV